LKSDFPSLDIRKLENLLSGRRDFYDDPAHRVIYFLLNSSIDCRVLDFLRRDSIHVGIDAGDAFQLDELLKHIVFVDDQLAVRSTGLSAVEQVVSLRYWLFSRLYWNQPARALTCMFKYVFTRLDDEAPGFADKLRRGVLKRSYTDLLRVLRIEARKAKVTDVLEIMSYLERDRPKIFRELIQFTRGEGDAQSRLVCDAIQGLAGFELLK
jgi:HD superfamily phosphohydrolase